MPDFHQRPFFIRVLVPTGDPDGLRIVEKSNWPGVGVVDSLEAGTRMRKLAQDLGALTVAPGVEVTGIDTEHGRVKRVRTDSGDIETETVAIACGRPRNSKSTHERPDASVFTL